MGLTNKTDKLDARGLAILLRNGTLPEVWIPLADVRDQREMLRLRIFLVRLRTRVKNRIHGTLGRHNVQIPGADRAIARASGAQPCSCRATTDDSGFFGNADRISGALAGIDNEAERGSGSAQGAALRVRRPTGKRGYPIGP